jgi:GNAT superfamily N-acetyltransferase
VSAQLNAEKAAYEISTDRQRLDLEMIHRFLANSYWARNIPRELVEKMVTNSMCFGAYHRGAQVGFGRVITDYTTVAYLADVFVLPEHRGKGVGRMLVNAMLHNPELSGLRRWLLATKDAHGLYQKAGFKALSNPSDFLTIHHPDVYSPV